MGTTLDGRPPAAVDPRMRARRIAVRRSDARKRLHRLIAAGVVAGLVAAALIAVRSPVLDVDRVHVVGAEHTGADAVRAAAGIRPHEPMVDVDAGAVRTRLLALPWVADAKVVKQWPATVAVTLVERTPVAVQPAGAAGYAVLDGTGRVLEVAPTPPAGLAQLAGLPDAGAPGSPAPPEAAPALTVANALPPSLRPRVAEIATAAGGVVDLHLVDAGIVRLGPPDELPAKLLATLTVLEQVDLTDVCTIDVRVPAAPSLTRASPCL